MIRTLHLKLVVFSAVALAPSWCRAEFTSFFANLTPLNNSGVSGRADLELNGNLLTVRIQASGLEPNMVHPQHIHGRFDADGNPIDSVTPPPSADTDGDGFVELAEGLPFYGPVILPLTSPPGGALSDFPTAPDGTIDFTQTYDLTESSIFADRPGGGGKFNAGDLMPLFLREIVLHGMTVGSAGAGTSGEVNGEAGYKAVLPVAAGEIHAVPEPASIAMFGIGLVGVIGYCRRRRSDARPV